MTPRLQSILVALGVTLYCGWQAHGLINDWRWSPYNHWCALVFLIWLVPLAVEYALFLRAGQKVEPAIFLLWTALAFSLVGSLGELNVLRHIGFGLALVGCLSWKPVRFPLLIAIVTWLPAFGYATSKASLSPSTTEIIRLALAALISGWLLISLKRKLPGQT